MYVCIYKCIIYKYIGFLKWQIQCIYISLGILPIFVKNLYVYIKQDQDLKHYYLTLHVYDCKW